MTTYLTAREAADRCRYLHTRTFLRAFRAAGFEVFKPTLRKVLVSESDIEPFLSSRTQKVRTQLGTIGNS